MVQGIILTGFLAYYLLGNGLWALFRFKPMEKAILEGCGGRKDLYRETLVSSWIPAVLLMAAVLSGAYQPEGLGLCGISWHHARWFSISFTVLFMLALVFFLYQTVMLRITAMKGGSIAFRLTDSLLALLPETRHEKILWAGVSLSAGITEELMFRGYLMHALGSLFPGLSLIACLLISSAVFGAMHLYLGAGDALKTAGIGVFYGLAFMAFGSVLPGMLLHFIQDLSSMDLQSVRERSQAALT